MGFLLVLYYVSELGLTETISDIFATISLYELYYENNADNF